MKKSHLKIKKIGFATGVLALPTLPLLALACAADLPIIGASIIPSDFEIQGASTKGTIFLRSAKVLDSHVEVRYYVGKEFPVDQSNFSVLNPQNLENGQIVWIKLFLKPEFANSFTLLTVPIHIAINTLNKAALNFKIVPDNFGVDGQSTGGSIVWSGSQPIPEQVQLGYVISDAKPTSDLAYSFKAPVIHNGDKLWIKTFIKANFQENYELSELEPISIDINTLTKWVLQIQPSHFSVTGVAEHGVLQIAPELQQTLASKGELRYYVGDIEPQMDSSYRPNLPSTLKNGQRVWIKSFSVNQTFYDGQNQALTINVQNLPKMNLTLNKNDFRVWKIPEENYVSIILDGDKDGQISRRAIVKYFVGTSAPTNVSDYKTSLARPLQIGDRVWITLESLDPENYTTEISPNPLFVDIV